MRTVDFYASHEALLLDYENAMTRIDSRSQEPYDTSGHMVWIGERTRQPDGAHVELLRSVRNPLGVKLGPTATAEDALETVSYTHLDVYKRQGQHRAGPTHLPIRGRPAPVPPPTRSGTGV